LPGQPAEELAIHPLVYRFTPVEPARSAFFVDVLTPVRSPTESIPGFMQSLASRFIILILLFAIAGCAGSGRVRYESPEEAVTKGQTEYEAENYTKAMEYFQGAFDFGRTHQWAADAQLFLARSYRETEQYLLAANEYTRFTQIFRSDPRVPQAAYELAMTYYARSPA